MIHAIVTCGGGQPSQQHGAEVDTFYNDYLPSILIFERVSSGEQ